MCVVLGGTLRVPLPSAPAPHHHPQLNRPALLNVLFPPGRRLVLHEALPERQGEEYSHGRGAAPGAWQHRIFSWLRCCSRCTHSSGYLSGCFLPPVEPQQLERALATHSRTRTPTHVHTYYTHTPTTCGILCASPPAGHRDNVYPFLLRYLVYMCNTMVYLCNTHIHTPLPHPLRQVFNNVAIVVLDETTPAAQSFFT